MQCFSSVSELQILIFSPWILFLRRKVCSFHGKRVFPGGKMHSPFFFPVESKWQGSGVFFLTYKQHFIQ